MAPDPVITFQSVDPYCARPRMKHRSGFKNIWCSTKRGLRVFARISAWLLILRIAPAHVRRMRAVQLSNEDLAQTTERDSIPPVKKEMYFGQQNGSTSD